MMKRSRRAALVLMGVSPLLLTACDDTAQDTREAAYTSVEHCVKDGGTQDSCVASFDAAKAEHAKSAPRYSTHEACVAEYGADQCTQHTDSSGGSFWMPLMTGFFISQMLHGGSSSYYATPLYRRRDGQYVHTYAPSPSGGASGYGNRAPTEVRPVTIQPNRAITVSRSGFGSSAAARGSWGS